MNAFGLDVDEGKLADFCRRNGIQKLALFGSALTDRFSDKSDVDVLVEFRPGYRVGYLGMASMERELSSIFGGRKVDLRTPNELSHCFRDEVVRTAAVQYAAEWLGPPAAYARRWPNFGLGRSREDLARDRIRTLAIVKCVEMIGEAASRVTSDTRSQHQEIPWADIVGMRNRLIHVYFEIDLDRVCDTVANDLPPLVTSLSRLLSD